MVLIIFIVNYKFKAMKSIFTFLVTLLSLYSYSQTIGIQTFASGFSEPVEITHPVGDARLFVVQQGGAIRILNPDGTVNATNFLALPSTMLSSGNEQGLLGLAFHPDYATNGYFYINYTNASGNTVVARYSVSANPDVANTVGTPILTVAQPFSNHNGGTLRFGPDGYLYIGMGDGGSGGDPGNRAQNINENLGKMLRIDVDSGTPYGIPPGNPYVGVAGNDEIWAVGLRNPWKFSFNRLNGDLWIADVGQGSVEEINVVPATLANANYGWKCFEGNNVYTTGCSVATTTYTFPVATYGHSGGACSVTGGYFYTGPITTLADKYFFADYCSNRIGYIPAAGGTITWSNAFSGQNFTTFGEDINGVLYVAGGSSGVVSRIVDTSLATSTFSKSGMQLYPNPASFEVFIKSEGVNFPASVSIFDISGKLLLTESLASEHHAMATGSLQSGTYLLTVKDNAGADYNTKLTIK
jgi:glucose/arabinose dehydrogenase